MIVENGGPPLDLEEAVLFPFDSRSVPLRYRLEPGLVAATNPYKPHPHVLEPGGPEAPDHIDISFYGTVIRIGDELRMWYIGVGEEDGEKRGPHICYAVSQDGLHWEKPELGMVEFNGNTRNNLVRFDSPHRESIGALLVLYDPEDPDPERRFKLINEIHPFHNIAAFSPDGLTWTESPHNPILKHNAIEPGGLMKFNGCYYMNGQGGNVGSKRALVTYMSYDFDHWTEAVAVGLRRDVPPYRQLPGPHAGEQVHLGASLWNRGNVVIGVYGAWHGESNDRSFVSMDLGLVVSNDGLQFAEPIPDFQLVAAYEVDYRDPVNAHPQPCLEQGQGFENMGDETLFWYAPWRGGFVCVARWLRDRLGYFEVVPDPKQHLGKDAGLAAVGITFARTSPHFISCPVRLGGKPTRVFLNADGLSAEAQLRVELLDLQLRPIDGYSGDACVSLCESGLRQDVTWRNSDRLSGLTDPIRLRVTWEGRQWDAAYFYAAYLEHA